MLTQEQKKSVVTDLKDRFARASSVFVADYRGLSVQQVNDLRVKLRGAEENYEYRVAKNTLIRRAIEGSAAEPIGEHLKGPTAVAFSFGEPVGLAKLLVDYAKDNEAFELKGGFLDGQPVDKEQVAQLATLPTLDELRSQLIGLLQAPAQKIAAVLQAPATQLARVMDARRAQLEESGGGS